MNNTIKWTDRQEPVGLSMDQLLYRIRQSDAKEGLIFDSVTLDDILSEDGVELFAFDALSFAYSLLRRKMKILHRTMNRAGGNLEVLAVQISDPFRRNGVAQVAVVFELSDGQTVSVYFHNPSSSPGRIAPKDEMISWKWMLNKKDITIVVAPERGNDIAIREVTRRVMKLADKNTAAFAKANAKRAERLENISNMKVEIEGLEVELEDLNKKIEIVKLEQEDEALKPKASVADGLSFLESIKSFIGRSQYRTISKAMRGEEKEFFIDKARVLAGIIDGMAKTYDQDGKGLEATAFLHYFQGSSDWYITEKDTQGGTTQAFGYAKMSQGGEMGYISIDELTKNDIELDLHFDPQTLSAAVGKVGDKPQDSDAVMVAARSMVSSVLSEFGGTIAAWEAMPDAVGPWDYAGAAIGELELRVGVSSGGVVSIDGKPHDPEGRVIDTPDALRSALSALLPVEDLSYELDKAGVVAMDEDQFKAEVAALEDSNARSESLVLLAKRKGTDGQVEQAQSILAEHVGAGEATPELIERREALRAELEQVKQGAPVSETPAAAITVSDDVIVPEGAESKVKTAKGTEIATGFTVIEADKLIASHDSVGNPNPDYPQELQPRDRSRTSSVAWVRKVSKQLDPDSLGKTRRADSGAPIVGPDGVVESGNGRTMAIQEAYRNGDAGEYREWLESEADFYGLDAGKIKAMRAPVLVRVRTSSIDRRQFAIEANQDDKLAMTGTEKAKADADRLDTGLMSTLGDDGNLLAASNRSFVVGFLQSLGESESAQYMTTNGQPTGALIARIQAAIFAKAYNDDRLLEMSADVTKPEVANVIEALNVAAPEFILARNADEEMTKTASSQIVDSVEAAMNQQAIEAIIQATNLVRQSRADGTSVEDAVNQMGLFGDISPATAAMALFINKNNRSAKRLGIAFKAMAEFVKQEAERGQTVDMFGDATPVELSDIIAAANRKLGEEYGEGAFAIDTLDMFSPQPEVEPATGAQDDLDEAEVAGSNVVAQAVAEPESQKPFPTTEEMTDAFVEGLKPKQEPLGNAPADMPNSINQDNTSVGDTVVWRNEFGTMEGNFRGFMDDGKNSVLVVSGSQMTAPTSEVFPVEPTEPEAPAPEPEAVVELKPEIEISNGSVDTFNNWSKNLYESVAGWRLFNFDRGPFGRDIGLARKVQEKNEAGGGYVSAQFVKGFSSTEDAKEWAKKNKVTTGSPNVVLEPAAEPVTAPEPTLEPEAASEPVVTPVPAPVEQSQVVQLNDLMKLAPKAGETVRSDDPAAIEKLEAKLSYLQALAALMRDANKHVRKEDNDALAAMGFKEKTITALYEPDFAGNIGFAKYKMTNNSGEVGRTRRRLAQLYKEREEQSQQEVEPMQEAPEAPEAPASSDDSTFLQSVINGTALDILSPETGDKITAALERNIDNEGMAELLEKAVMAYQTQVEQATADI